MPRFSLIISAYNEANYLPRLLDTVDEARRCYRGNYDAIEIIVADNMSTNSTAQIARARDCKVAQIERRCIASVRNCGAALATAEYLCFVDADMRVHPETFNSIESCIHSGRVVAGATGVVLERMSSGIALTYGFIITVVWLTKVDTGVVFCRKADFARIGGYREDMEVAEDVQLLLDTRSWSPQRAEAGSN